MQLTLDQDIGSERGPQCVECSSQLRRRARKRVLARPRLRGPTPATPRRAVGQLRSRPTRTASSPATRWRAVRPRAHCLVANGRSAPRSHCILQKLNERKIRSRLGMRRAADTRRGLREGINTLRDAGSVPPCSPESSSRYRATVALCRGESLHDERFGRGSRAPSAMEPRADRGRDENVPRGARLPAACRRLEGSAAHLSRSRHGVPPLRVLGAGPPGRRLSGAAHRLERRAAARRDPYMDARAWGAAQHDELGETRLCRPLAERGHRAAAVRDVGGGAARGRDPRRADILGPRSRFDRDRSVRRPSWAPAPQRRAAQRQRAPRPQHRRPLLRIADAGAHRSRLPAPRAAGMEPGEYPRRPGALRRRARTGSDLG